MIVPQSGTKYKRILTITEKGGIMKMRKIPETPKGTFSTVAASIGYTS